jgi:hypothetical protein
MGSTLLNLVHQHPDIKQLLFPNADSSIDLQELMKLVDYDVTDDNYKFAASEVSQQWQLPQPEEMGEKILLKCTHSHHLSGAIVHSVIWAK